MTYKLIALDLDGTLKTSDNRISPKTREALIECQKRGMRVILASGRPTPGLRHEAEELELAKYGGLLLSFNGARVYDITNDKVIYEKVVDRQYALEIYDRAKQYGLAVMTYDGLNILTEDDDDQYVQVEQNINDMYIKHTDAWKETLPESINKVLLTGTPEYVASIEQEFKAPYQDVLSIYRSAPFFIEVMAQNIDKAASLEKLCEYLGMTSEDMIAFGDGFNDISMIKFAGLGVAMGNAQDVVKEAANEITLSNDEDGIYETLKRVIGL